MPYAAERPRLPNSVGIPSQCLRVRPDIAAASAIRAAATPNPLARRLLPPTSLSAPQGGFESSALQNLRPGPARFWSVGTPFPKKIFDRRLRRAT